MLITLRKSTWQWAKRLCERCCGLVRERDETSRGTSDTVRGIVGVVRTGPGGLDVRTSIRTEPPFRKGRKGQQYLSNDQEADRRLQKRRLNHGGVADARHHC
jgi:hypothetical protein